MSESTSDALASANEPALPAPTTERLLNGRFVPGHTSVSQGRPKGSRNRAKLLAQSMMHDDTEAIFGKLLELAKQGNMAALKFCAERIVPRMTSETVDIELPRAETIEGVAAAQGAVVEAMACGEIDPDQAKTVAGVLELRRKSLESEQFEERIGAMEDHMAKVNHFRGREQ